MTFLSIPLVVVYFDNQVLPESQKVVVGGDEKLIPERKPRDVYTEGVS